MVDLGSWPDPSLVRLVGHWLAGRGALAVLLSPVAAWQQGGGGVPGVLQLDAEDVEMMAGWAAASDMVLTGDVPLAHLAGGMGLRAEVLLPVGHDPLWGAQAETTPWYPSVRLHREPPAGGWDAGWGAIEAVLNAHFGAADPVVPEPACG